jgi:hypothetical protein
VALGEVGPRQPHDELSPLAGSRGTRKWMVAGGRFPSATIHSHAFLIQSCEEQEAVIAFSASCQNRSRDPSSFGLPACSHKL